MNTVALRNFLFGGAGGNVFRGMATLALGGSMAKVIAMASIPFLTRIYSPADYGVLAIFSAFISMLVPVLTFRYVVAIPLPRHDGIAMNLMVLSAALMVITTLTVLTLLYLFGEGLLNLLSMSALVPYWWLIGAGLLGAATYELLSMWATRRRAYAAIARTQVLQSLVGAAVKIALGLMAIKPLGLMVGQVVNLSGGIGSLTRNFAQDMRRNARFVSLRRLRIVTAYYFEFPLYRLPSQFLLQFSMQAPLLFAASTYDAAITGQLGLALMAVTLPVGLLGQSMSVAYQAEASKLGRKKAKEVYSLTLSVLGRLAILGAFPAVVLLLFGEQLFVLVFGHQWQQAGTFAAILSAYMLFQFVSRPVPHIFSIFGRNKTYLLTSMNRLLLISAIFWFGYYFELPINHVMMIYSAVLSAHYVLVTLRAIMLIRSNFGVANPGKS